MTNLELIKYHGMLMGGRILKTCTRKYTDGDLLLAVVMSQVNKN